MILRKACVLAWGCAALLGLATSSATMAAPSSNITPTHEGSDRLERLEQQVSDLLTRVTALEQRGGGGDRSWSCTAQCGGYRYDRLDYRMVSGTGATAGEAFGRMNDRCDEHLFNGLYNDPGRTLIPATLANSCIRG